MEWLRNAQHESYREYIVVLIDADKDMLVKEGERCCLDTALECAIALLRTKCVLCWLGSARSDLPGRQRTRRLRV
jgi:hypothetical protein